MKPICEIDFDSYVKMCEELSCLRKENGQLKEKQVRKSLLNKEVLKDYYGRPYEISGGCPCCNVLIIHSASTFYCCKCGQKLDWN